MPTSMEYDVIGRVEEMKTLNFFIRSNVKARKTASLYVSGLPGTGKTLCVQKAVETLQRNLDFHVVWINCMRITSVGDFYSSVCDALDVKSNKRAKRGTPSKYTVQDVEKVFTTSSTMLIVCLDEIDQLQQAFPSLLTRAFQWPSLPNSSVLLIGIANSFDLTDRCLSGLDVKTKLKPQLLHFRPYESDEIVAIVRNRLSSYRELLSPEAVELCARKCAAFAGDIRKALDTCKLVVEQATNQKTSGSSPSDTASARASEVLTAIQDVYGSKRNGRCVTLPLQQKLFFAAAFRLSSFGIKQFSIGKLFEQYKRLCESIHVPAIETNEVTNICDLLEGTYGLLRKTKKPNREAYYTLHLADSNAQEIINDDRLLSVLISDT